MEEKTLDELSFLVNEDKLRENSTLNSVTEELSFLVKMRENSTLNSVTGQNILSLKIDLNQHENKRKFGLENENNNIESMIAQYNNSMKQVIAVWTSMISV